MTINQFPNNTSPVLFRIQEEILPVNQSTSSFDMRRQSQLHLSFLNVSEEELVFTANSKNADSHNDNSSKDDGGFSIRLDVFSGGGNNMFSKNDAKGYGVLESSELFESTSWVTHPVKKNCLYCIIRLRDGKTVSIKPGLGLHFLWKRIVSTASEGYTYIQAAIAGLTGGCDELIQSDYLCKVQAGMRIVHFSASPSCGAPGEEIMLSWQVENASHGILLPEGHDIFGEIMERRGKLAVILDENISRYELNLIDHNSGIFRHVHVFVAPPVISLLRADHSTSLSWETHFASRVLLTWIGADRLPMTTQEVEPSGSLTLPDHVTQAALHCEGFYPIERILILPPIPEIQNMYVEYQTYHHHMSIRLVWETKGLKAFSLYIGDGEAYTISTIPQGQWTQVYQTQQKLDFIALCQTDDGTEYEIPFGRTSTDIRRTACEHESMKRYEYGKICEITASCEEKECPDNRKTCDMAKCHETIQCCDNEAPYKTAAYYVSRPVHRNRISCNTMLYAEVSPRGIYTSRNEPCMIKNSLVLQLHNAASHEVTLYNENIGRTYDFAPLEQAVPIDGLTMIYFTFPLGRDEGCLTTTEAFGEALLYCAHPFEAARAGENSIVLYPAQTVAFSIYDIAELRIQDLMTQMSAGGCPICRITLFSEDGITALNPLPICLFRHPLQITAFQADPRYYPAGFGDQIQFNYQVLGADRCIFSPGDTPLTESASMNGVHISTLYRKTQYTLTAFCGDEQISHSVELTPLKASIRSFSASVTNAAPAPQNIENDSREITFRFTVDHAHHAYLSRIGRIEIASGVEQTLTCSFDCSVNRFTLSVENEDGLVQAVCDLDQHGR